MQENSNLELIENQILQIESYLWERDFETSFKLKRLVNDSWELISWQPLVGRYRLTFTRIASYELSGGVPDLEVCLAEATDQTKLKIGPHLENFMMKFFELSDQLKKQTKEIESFGSYLNSLEEKIGESQKEIRRAANSKAI